MSEASQGVGLLSMMAEAETLKDSQPEELMNEMPDNAERKENANDDRMGKAAFPDVVRHTDPPALSATTFMLVSPLVTWPFQLHISQRYGHLG